MADAKSLKALSRTYDKAKKDYFSSLDSLLARYKSGEIFLMATTLKNESLHPATTRELSIVFSDYDKVLFTIVGDRARFTAGNGVYIYAWVADVG